MNKNKIAKPYNWAEIAEGYMNKQILRKDACKRLFISGNTFYNWLMEDYPERAKHKRARNKKIIKPDNWHELAESYMANEMRMADLARKLNVSEPLVYNWFKEDYPDRKRKEHANKLEIPSDFVEQYMKYHNKEIEMEELEWVFGASRNTINIWKRKLLPNIKRRIAFSESPKKEKPANYEKLVEMYLEGYIKTQKILKYRLDTCYPTLRKWVKEDYGKSLIELKKERQDEQRRKAKNARESKPTKRGISQLRG